MKLTIKTLQQSTFKVDIDPDKTVKDLKDAIEHEQGKDYPCDAQKLIYSGKILANENKLSEYEFDEKKFIVLMITRPPPVSKQQSEQTSNTSSATTSENVASKTTKTESNDDTKLRRTTRSSAAAAIASSENSTNSSSSRTTTTTTSSSTTATNAAPTSTGNLATVQTPAATTDQARQVESRSSALSNEASILAMGEPQVASRLASMMAQPYFRQMQDLIQQSPHLLHSMIDTLAASDPEVHDFINQNPDVFVNALNHPPSATNRIQATGGNHQQSDTMSQQQVMAAMAAAAAAAGIGPGGQQQRVVDHLHGVSEHDKEAIERLKELGFSEYLAVQAYMACDKDEQLAADLLFQMD